MIYYKITEGGSVVAALTENDLRKHQPEHNTLAAASPEEAEYIQATDMILYHDSWMRDTSTGVHSFRNASVTAITKEEYEPLCDSFLGRQRLSEANGRLPEIAPLAVVEESEFEDETDTFEFIRTSKLKQLSLACQNAILNGFDVELDGVKHHFSLTVQDQANLAEARWRLLKGELLVPYHANGEEMRFYTQEEMNAVIEAADAHKMYNLIYFNALKLWVNSLKRASSISKISYGDEIPKKYQTDLLERYQPT